TVADGASGSADVHIRNNALEFVMSGAVKEVADSHYASGFSCEIDCQSGGRAAEDAHDRIHFGATALQIGSSHGEICGVEPCNGGEENRVLLVPKTMADFGTLHGHDH